MMYVIYFIALLSPLCLAQEFFTGSCSKYNYNIVQDFEATKYLGKWYEYKRYPAFFEKDADCVTADYSLQDDEKIKVVNSQKNLKRNGHNSSVTGVAQFVDPAKKEGKLTVKFSKFAPEGNYWVIGTDYINYSVVWSCSQMLAINVQFLWILTRDAIPSPDIVDKAGDILTKAGIDQNRLRMTTNDNSVCHFY